MRIIYLFLGFSLIFFSCSSAPKQQDDIVKKKNQAVEYTEFGNDYFNQGLYDKALEFFNLSLAYNISVDNESGIIQSYNSIGKVYMARGAFKDAELSYLEAEKLAEKLDLPQLKSQTANNLGEVYLNQEKLADSKTQFVKALEYKEKGLPEENLAIIYHNLGSVYKREGQKDKALEYFELALEINLRKKRFEEVSANYYMIGSIHSEKSDYDTALENLMLALKYDKQVENSLGIAKDFLVIGIVYSKAGKNQESYEYFKKTYLVYRALIVLYPDLPINTEVITVLKYLVEIGEKLGLTKDIEEYKALLGYNEEMGSEIEDTDSGARE